LVLVLVLVLLFVTLGIDTFVNNGFVTSSYELLLFTLVTGGVFDILISLSGNFVYCLAF